MTNIQRMPLCILCNQALTPIYTDTNSVDENNKYFPVGCECITCKTKISSLQQLDLSRIEYSPDAANLLNFGKLYRDTLDIYEHKPLPPGYSFP